jgi:hypothetical protein
MKSQCRHYPRQRLFQVMHDPVTNAASFTTGLSKSGNEEEENLTIVLTLASARLPARSVMSTSLLIVMPPHVIQANAGTHAEQPKWHTRLS